MNQCLANPTDDPARDPDACVADDDGAEVTGGGEGAEDEGAAEGETRVIAAQGRVLLIEDDPAFNEATRVYLTDCGYTVVPVLSGEDGLQEVLAGDFELIFCDLALPTMPGDVFYRAVEKIRPQLCRRFVFMTGYRDDARTSEFIKQVGAYVLRKPFPLKHLVDSIGFIEVLGSFKSVFEAGPPQADAPPARPPTDRFLANAVLFRASADAASKPEPAPAAPAAPVVPTAWRAPTAPAAPSIPAVPTPQHSASPVPIPARRMSVVTRAFAASGLALGLVLALNLGIRKPDARDRAAAAASERRALEIEWRTVSAQATQAAQLRNSLASLPRRAERLANERNASSSNVALRAISRTASAEIELHGVVVRGVEGSPGAFRILIEGVASGRMPRETTNTFHAALRGEVGRRFPGAVQLHVDRLEDDPEISSSPSDRRTARFTLTMQVATSESSKEKSPVAK